MGLDQGASVQKVHLSFWGRGPWCRLWEGTAQHPTPPGFWRASSTGRLQWGHRRLERSAQGCGEGTMSSTSLPAQIWAPLQPCSLGAHLGGRTWCNRDLVQQRPGATETWCNRDLVQQRPGATETWCNRDLVQQRPGATETWCNRFGTAALAARIAHGIAQGVGAAGALCRSVAPSL